MEVPRTKLWSVPLHTCVTNLNTHTLLLNGHTGTESLNSLYSLPSTTKMLSHLEVFNHIRPSAVEAINNVYELPIIEPAIRYLHGAAGFPTKATWIKSIQKGNYLTYTLTNVKNVNNVFPSWRKLKNDISATNAKEYGPPKNLTLPPISISRI